MLCAVHAAGAGMYNAVLMADASKTLGEALPALKRIVPPKRK